MSIDPRCEFLIEKTAKYHALTAKIIEKRLEQMCRKHGLKDTLCLGDYEFLCVVANARTPDVSMAQVARQLGVNPSSATRRNRRLLECGLVSKTSAAADERRYQIALTEDGRTFWEEMDKTLYDMTQVVYSTITEEEMNAVYAFTEKCVANLQKILDE